jgi:RNA polymerase sigma-70 factor (ECF subfamily)
MASERGDAEVVREVLAGSQAAFGELVARYKDAVFGVAFHRLGDFEEARDVAQDAFVKAYLSLSKLRDGDAFGNWLYRIADGTAVDAARRRRGELSLENPDSLDANRLLPSPTRDDALVAGQVREALSQLGEADRLAVVLHYVNGYSHAEVAQFLGTTPGAVKTRVSRAKAKLRKEMAEMVERKLKQERMVFHYKAFDPSGRLVTGTSVASSENEVVSRLGDKGYSVQVIHGRQRTARELRLEDRGVHEAMERVADVILGQALADRASAVKIELARQKGESPLVVTYLIGEAWHEVMRVPEYVWPPLRAQFARMAGISVSEEATRRSGTIAFPSPGKQRTFRIVFHKRTVRLDVLP